MDFWKFKFSAFLGDFGPVKIQKFGLKFMWIFGRIGLSNKKPKHFDVFFSEFFYRTWAILGDLDSFWERMTQFWTARKINRLELGGGWAHFGIGISRTFPEQKEK